MTRRRQIGGSIIPMYRGHNSFQFGGNIQPFRGSPFQYGGFIPVYSGAPNQYGNGLGDILRGIGRFLFPIISPIAARAASSFITNTSDGINQGKSFGESAKGAFAPALSETINAAKDQVMGKFQHGSGRRRVYKSKNKAKAIKRKHSRKISKCKKRRISAPSNF